MEYKNKFLTDLETTGNLWAGKTLGGDDLIIENSIVSGDGSYIQSIYGQFYEESFQIPSESLSIYTPDDGRLRLVNYNDGSSLDAHVPIGATIDALTLSCSWYQAVDETLSNYETGGANITVSCTKISGGELGGSYYESEQFANFFYDVQSNPLYVGATFTITPVVDSDFIVAKKIIDTRKESANVSALGKGIAVLGDGTTALGQYNKPDQDGNNILEVGYGTSEADRKNAIEVHKDGTTKLLELVTANIVAEGNVSANGDVSAANLVVAEDVKIGGKSLNQTVVDIKDELHDIDSYLKGNVYKFITKTGSASYATNPWNIPESVLNNISTDKLGPCISPTITTVQGKIIPYKLSHTFNNLTITYDPLTEIFTFNGTTATSGDPGSLDYTIPIRRLQISDPTKRQYLVPISGTHTGKELIGSEIGSVRLRGPATYNNTVYNYFGDKEGYDNGSGWVAGAFVTTLYFYLYAGPYKKNITFNNFKCKFTSDGLVDAPYSGKPITKITSTGSKNLIDPAVFDNSVTTDEIWYTPYNLMGSGARVEVWSEDTDSWDLKFKSYYTLLTTGTYTISLTPCNTECTWCNDASFYVDTLGAPQELTAENNWTATFTINKTSKFAIKIYYAGWDDSIEVWPDGVNVMLESGDSASAYEDPVIQNNPAFASFSALMQENFSDTYGLALNTSIYNYVNFETKQYIINIKIDSESGLMVQLEQPEIIDISEYLVDYPGDILVKSGGILQMYSDSASPANVAYTLTYCQKL